MSAQTEAWRTYRGSLRTRILLAALIEALAVDEERNLRQAESSRCLLDSPRGRRRLDDWSAPPLQGSAT